MVDDLSCEFSPIETRIRALASLFEPESDKDTREFNSTALEGIAMLLGDIADKVCELGNAYCEEFEAKRHKDGGA